MYLSIVSQCAWCRSGKAVMSSGAGTTSPTPHMPDCWSRARTRRCRPTPCRSASWTRCTACCATSAAAATWQRSRACRWPAPSRLAAPVIARHTHKIDPSMCNPMILQLGWSQCCTIQHLLKSLEHPTTMVWGCPVGCDLLACSLHKDKSFRRVWRHQVCMHCMSGCRVALFLMQRHLLMLVGADGHTARMVSLPDEARRFLAQRAGAC